MSNSNNRSDLFPITASTAVLAFVVGGMAICLDTNNHNAAVKDTLLKSPKTKIYTENKVITNGDTLTTKTSTPAHIVPDSLILKL